MAVEISGQRPVGDWIALIKEANSAFDNRLDQIYGHNEDLKTEAAQMCLRSLEEFTERYDADRSVIIVRSAGRVNLLGTHIDHRGGSVNPVCVKQMWLVVEPRDDDRVLAKMSSRVGFPMNNSVSVPACRTGRKSGTGIRGVTMNLKNANTRRRLPGRIIYAQRCCTFSIST